MGQVLKCDHCGLTIEVGDWPFCPHGPVGRFNVIPDSIPGGQVIENLTPQPKRYYSRTEIKDQMRLLNVEPKVEHKGTPGSDKSPHTQRWI